MGKPSEALTSYEAALAIRRKLADANPTVTTFPSEMAWSYNDIGNLLLEAGKPADALTSFKAGPGDPAEAFADENPGSH